MPFTKHVIEPIRISQCPLPAGEPNELECLSNLTLANLIRQLSSLGQHAGRIFDELSKDATQLNNRALIMHQRLENLKSKCQHLDIQSEEVTLADFQTKKQFKSSVKMDQQVVSRKTMPEAMKIMYNNADPPPALDKLNPYRQDGKDCMKFYTDPGFFFNIWCNELFKDNETRKIEKKRRKTKNQHQPQPVAPHISNPVINNGKQFDEVFFQQQQAFNMTQGLGKQQPQTYYQQHNQQNYFEDHLPPPPPPIHQPQMQQNYEIYAEASQHHTNNMNIQRTQVRQVQATNVQSQSNGQQKIYSSERPVLPPPPIPSQNHLSDLQQIQQQMIRKKQTDYNGGEINGLGNSDLPPPPSLPDNAHPLNGDSPSLTSSQQITITAEHLMKLNLSAEANDLDMPLPPPPIDLHDSYSNNNINNLPAPLPASSSNLPPPPPLPPLVESDTVSTSSSASINNTPTQTKSADTSKNSQPVRGSYLDDINQRRFQLKSSKKETGGSNGNSSIISDGKENGDNIQPFVNNSDVAAIIDFIRKFRPHVRDSSEEDEENSDWDD